MFQKSTGGRLPNAHLQNLATGASFWLTYYPALLQALNLSHVVRLHRLKRRLADQGRQDKWPPQLNSACQS
ncbi:hypothetical protein TorRG33x02_054360 [Trema orientale]|uniref:Uncharacterized protein n=1 Tax=Trema orientale TaxID=63057 RepID=A0A2P5FLZ4_TREOI|nr:hypothetical protein TorRG33x02_054360 [Trema orientale]